MRCGTAMEAGTGPELKAIAYGPQTDAGMKVGMASSALGAANGVIDPGLLVRTRLALVWEWKAGCAKVHHL